MAVKAAAGGIPVEILRALAGHGASHNQEPHNSHSSSSHSKAARGDSRNNRNSNHSKQAGDSSHRPPLPPAARGDSRNLAPRPVNLQDSPDSGSPLRRPAGDSRQATRLVRLPISSPRWQAQAARRRPTRGFPRQWSPGSSLGSGC